MYKLCCGPLSGVSTLCGILWQQICLHNVHDKPGMSRAAHSYILCYMELREGDVAENQNIRSSRGAAEYNLTFEMVLPGGPVQFGFSNSPAGRLSPIDKPAKADRSGDRTRPP